jgi:hypothetical protein
MKIEIKTWLSGSIFSEGDFSSLVKALEAAVAARTNLSGAVLSGAVLSGAVLSGKIIQTLPVLANPDQRILEIIKKGEGALNMGHWHECETTHCRAGWYIKLSGPAGQMFEAMCGSAVAGALIFSKAYPGRKVPNFYASDSDALKDMEQNAAVPVESAAATTAP